MFEVTSNPICEKSGMFHHLIFSLWTEYPFCQDCFKSVKIIDNPPSTWEKLKTVFRKR